MKKFFLPALCWLVSVGFTAQALYWSPEKTLPHVIFSGIFSLIAAAMCAILGYEYKEIVLPEKRFHTIGEDTKKVKIAEYDAEGALISEKIYKYDPKWIAKYVASE